jgi:hypothetical protein
MKLDTAILLLREFNIGMRLHTEISAHFTGESTVTIRERHIHLLDNETREKVETLAKKKYPGVEIEVGANQLIMI